MEIWSDIASMLDASSFHRLSCTSKYFNAISKDTVTRKRLILRLTDNIKNDALVFAFKHQMVPVMVSLLKQPSIEPLTREFGDAFAQIVCHETTSLSDQERKLLVIREVLMSVKGNDKNAIAEFARPYIYELSPDEMAVMAFRWCVYYAEHLIILFLLDEYKLNIDVITCHSQWWIRMLKSKKYDIIETLLERGAVVSGVPAPESWEEILFTRLGRIAAHEVLPGNITRPHEINVANSRFALDGGEMFYPIRAMAMEGDLEALDLLLKKTPAFKTNEDLFDLALHTSLLASAYGNKFEVVDHLVKTYNLDLSECDPHADTLLVACVSGNMDFVQKYMEFVELEAVGRDVVSFALRLAVRDGFCDMVNFLIEKCKVDVNSGPNLLEIACNGGDLRMVEILLSHHVDVSRDDYAALKVAIKKAHFRIVNRLLREAEIPSHKGKAKGFAFRWKMLARFRELWNSPSIDVTRLEHSEEGSSSEVNVNEDLDGAKESQL